MVNYGHVPMVRDPVKSCHKNLIYLFIPFIIYNKMYPRYNSLDSIPTLSFDEYSSLNYSSEISIDDNDFSYDLNSEHYIWKIQEEKYTADEIDWDDTEIIFRSD